MAGPIAIAAEVDEALRRGRPVVALESTLIAQGLPWPTNLQTAREAEAAVRNAGAVPATIAVLGGRVRVGLEGGELEDLARAPACDKATRRDLAAAVAGGATAATTVSATLFVARRAGISAFATGGLGGIHRGAAATFDISADLDALAAADGVLVVCSGAKFILDLPATLEALETRGVTIVGYRTSELPAFTTPSSGLPLETRVDTSEAAARLVAAHRELGLPGAVVLAQPVDVERGVPLAVMEAAIDDALRTAERDGVRGKAVTPFLLRALQSAIGPTLLEANRALVVANARLAAEVAVVLDGPSSLGTEGAATPR